MYWATHWLGHGQTKLHKTQSLPLRGLYSALGVQLSHHTPKRYVEVWGANCQHLRIWPSLAVRSLYMYWLRWGHTRGGWPLIQSDRSSDKKTAMYRHRHTQGEYQVNMEAEIGVTCELQAKKHPRLPANHQKWGRGKAGLPNRFQREHDLANTWLSNF